MDNTNFYNFYGEKLRHLCYHCSCDCSWTPMSNAGEFGTLTDLKPTFTTMSNIKDLSPTSKKEDVQGRSN